MDWCLKYDQINSFKSDDVKCMFEWVHGPLLLVNKQTQIYNILILEAGIWSKVGSDTSIYNKKICQNLTQQYTGCFIEKYKVCALSLK